MTTTPPTEQQLDELTAIATRAAEHPFFVSDCEGSLQVWREEALVRVTRDEAGQIEGYSFPSTYKVTDQIIELDLSTWDPGEDATDDQQRQDIRDLVEARAALGALVAKIERLEGQRKVLLDQLARKDRASGAADVALAAFLGSEVPTEPETATEAPTPLPSDSAHPIADADNPTFLRWGLDDVLWGDDDSVIVLLSGPDLEPYWLELERAAVLRRNLAGPAEDPAPAEDFTGTQPCGHDDYHDPHPWADRPNLWCPGHSYDDDQAADEETAR